MTDLARLVLAVDSTEVKSADRALSGLESTANKAEAAAGKLMAVFAGLMTVLAGAKAFYDTNAEFQRLNASLITVTGSAGAAEKAFAMLQRLAKDTPYELSEVTQAFINLKARGMDASAESLLAYGDMASSFGRSLTDTIQAIAGVAMGETEAIKSFGVQATAAGDKVALTFKGQTEVINRSTSAVEAYFKQLAVSNFGGGMERQMKTLGGLMSNLKDQIAATFFAIGNAGASGGMGDGIAGLTKALDSATPALVRFTQSVTSTAASTVAVLNAIKIPIAALAALGFAVILNGWVVALAGMAAPLIKATALTLALDLATLKYATSAGVAAMASGGLKVAIAAIASPVGVLIIALGALYLATKSYRNETDALNRSIDEQQARMNKQQPILNARDRVRELREENERLRKVLSGDKSVKIRSTEGQALVSQVTKDGGDSAWADIVANHLDAELAANQKLKDKLDARNKAIKDTAAEMQRLEDAKKEMIRNLKKSNAEFANMASAGQWSFMKETDLDERAKQIAEAKRLGLAESAAIQQWTKNQEAISRYANEKRRAAERLEAAAKRTEEALARQGDYSSGMVDAASSLNLQYDPEKKYLDAVNRINALKKAGMLTDTAYVKALRDVEAEHGNLWAQMSLQVETYADTSAAALANFFNGTSSGFREMTISILTDLEKMIIKATITKPIFDALAKSINSMGSGDSWLSSLGSTVAGWFGGGSTQISGMSSDSLLGQAAASGGYRDGSKPYLVGERGPEIFNPGVSGTITPNNKIGGSSINIVNQINVTVADGQATTNTKSSAQQGQDIAKSLESMMDAWAAKNMRQGGLFVGGR